MVSVIGSILISHQFKDAISDVVFISFIYSYTFVDVLLFKVTISTIYLISKD